MRMDNGIMLMNILKQLLLGYHNKPLASCAAHSCPSNMIKRLDHLFYEEGLKSLGVFSLKKTFKNKRVHERGL